MLKVSLRSSYRFSSIDLKYLLSVDYLTFSYYLKVWILKKNSIYTRVYTLICDILFLFHLSVFLVACLFSFALSAFFLYFVHLCFFSIFSSINTTCFLSRSKKKCRGDYVRLPLDNWKTCFYDASLFVWIRNRFER